MTVSKETAVDRYLELAVVHAMNLLAVSEVRGPFEFTAGRYLNPDRPEPGSVSYMLGARIRWVDGIKFSIYPQPEPFAGLEAIVDGGL